MATCLLISESKPGERKWTWKKSESTGPVEHAAQLSTKLKFGQTLVYFPTVDEVSRFVSALALELPQSIRKN